VFVNKARIVFIFPIRRGTIKGDEPAIFEQNTETKAWTHYGCHVPKGEFIQVWNLEGPRLKKYNRDMEERKTWLKTHTLPFTKFPLWWAHKIPKDAWMDERPLASSILRVWRDF
jgi:hypothetical protein